MDDENPLDPESARTLRFLKALVTVLTITMIGGLLTITALLVIRLQPESRPTLPESIVLPDGTEPFAFTAGKGWYAVVTEDDRILIFDGSDGALLQEITIGR